MIHRVLRWRAMLMVQLRNNVSARGTAPYTNFERYALEFPSKQNEAWEHVMVTPLPNAHET